MKLVYWNDIVMVLDFIFLYDFVVDEKEFNVEILYFLVYMYGFDFDIIEEVKFYVKKMGFKVIFVGFYYFWVDKNIFCGLFEFLFVVKGVECIIIDIFYGLIFVIKYRKNFLSYGRYKNKVVYFFGFFGLLDNLVDVGFLLGGWIIEIDYFEVELRFSFLIDNSRNYLECCNLLVII